MWVYRRGVSESRSEGRREKRVRKVGGEKSNGKEEIRGAKAGGEREGDVSSLNFASFVGSKSY